MPQTYWALNLTSSLNLTSDLKLKNKSKFPKSSIRVQVATLNFTLANLDFYARLTVHTSGKVLKFYNAVMLFVKRVLSVLLSVCLVRS